MREEIIISGRMNPGVDPILQQWHWEIPIYLFVGGIAAGILFFAGVFFLFGKENKYSVTVKKAPLLVPIVLTIGLLCLVLDLSNKLLFWQLYANIKFQSPMSWGAWTLMVVMPVSIIWSAFYIKEWFPKWDWKYSIIKDVIAFLEKSKTFFAWIMVGFGLILGIYTGILFSAFNARPLWNTSILGPLFLASGLSAASAIIMYLAKDPNEKKMFIKIDLAVILIELFLIIHMFMGFLASTSAQQDAVQLFLGGEYTLQFWIFIVFIGMIVPAILEILELKKYHIPAIIPVLLVLFGSLMLRIIMTYAGQISRYLY